MLRISSEKRRLVQDVGKEKQNSPQSSCPETMLGTDGNSRYRVKVHLRVLRADEEEWYHGSLKDLTLSSLCIGKEARAFLS